MAKVKSSKVLNLEGIEITPDPPHEFNLSTEIMQTLAWLTALTNHDRRLLRCTENGALLTAEPWSLLNVVDTNESYPDSGSADVYATSVDNKGVLISTSTQIIKAVMVRIASGATETYYIPPSSFFWYPHSVYSVTCSVVPDPGGTASYVGLTFLH